MTQGAFKSTSCVKGSQHRLEDHFIIAGGSFYRTLSGKSPFHYSSFVVETLMWPNLLNQTVGLLIKANIHAGFTPVSFKYLLACIGLLSLHNLSIISLHPRHIDGTTHHKPSQSAGLQFTDFQRCPIRQF